MSQIGKQFEHIRFLPQQLLFNFTNKLTNTYETIHWRQSPQL